MRNLISKYNEYNSKIIVAPIKFIFNKNIPIYVKVLTVTLICSLIIFLGTRDKPVKNINGYSLSEIVGTYKSQNVNMGITQQFMLKLNKNKTFEATEFMDGKVSRKVSGIWKHIVIKDSVFDYGKLKEIKTNNYLECIDNEYHNSSKYQINLPMITTFSFMEGTSTDQLFGGWIREAPIEKE